MSKIIIPLSFGLEEEFFVTKVNGEEAYVNSDLVDEVSNVISGNADVEIHGAQLELISPITYSASELIDTMYKQREAADKIIRGYNLRLLGSGTHPSWEWSQATMRCEIDYYAELYKRLGISGKRNFISGMHLHIGMPQSNLIGLHNALLPFIPLLVAISANSPYWRGLDTGFQSYRNIIFRQLPRSGVPEYIMGTYSEYLESIQALLKSGYMMHEKDFWPDIRIHPVYRTVELRMFDTLSKSDDVAHVIAFVIGLVELCIKVPDELSKRFKVKNRSIIEENKHRCAQHGLEAKLVGLSDNVLEAKDLYLDILRLIKRHCQNIPAYLFSPMDKSPSHDQFNLNSACLLNQLSRIS